MHYFDRTCMDIAMLVLLLGNMGRHKPFQCIVWLIPVEVVCYSLEYP